MSALDASRVAFLLFDSGFFCFCGLSVAGADPLLAASASPSRLGVIFSFPGIAEGTGRGAVVCHLADPRMRVKKRYLHVFRM